MPEGKKSECGDVRHGHLYPWIEFCPVCGCKNEQYDPDVEIPAWLKDVISKMPPSSMGN